MASKLLFGICYLSILVYIAGDEIREVCPNIVTRSMWGAQTAKRIDYMIVPVQYVVIAHTVTPACNSLQACSVEVQSIQNYHMNNLQFDDIGLNFLIGGDGNVYEGAGWHKVGAHTLGYNKKAIGVAFIGTFINKLPSPKALAAGRKLLECGVQLGELDHRYKLISHRQVIATESPGLKLHQEIQTWPHWTSNVKPGGAVYIQTTTNRNEDNDQGENEQ